MDDKELIKQIRYDHDRLVRVETNVESIQEQLKTVCVKIDNLRSLMETHCEKTSESCNACKSEIYSDIERKNDKKIGRNMFMWIVAGVFAAILYNTDAIIALKTTYKDLRSEVTDHIAYSVLVFEEVTGQKWGAASRERLDEARAQYLKARNEALDRTRVYKKIENQKEN